jgi:hypothetical protein
MNANYDKDNSAVGRQAGARAESIWTTRHDYQPSGSITSLRMTPPTCGGCFIGMVLNSPFSMIVNQINVKRVALLETKNNSPIAAEGNPPESSQVALELVKPPAGEQPYVLRPFGFVDRKQKIGDLLPQWLDQSLCKKSR